MAVGEMAAWAALALSVIVGVVAAMLSRRAQRMERQLAALMKGTGPGAGAMSLGELVANQAARLEATRSEVEKLRQAVDALDASVARSVQHIGLVRYNPFQEAGGDQSFALALLDGLGNGVIITSLHSRMATRFYAKTVKDGTSPLSLSDEEAQALQQAMDLKRDA